MAMQKDPPDCNKLEVSVGKKFIVELKSETSDGLESIIIKVGVLILIGIILVKVL
jgi:hypothetical protein